MNDKILRVDFLLQLICPEHDFVLIENTYISVDDLWEDGIHQMLHTLNRVHFNYMLVFQDPFYLEVHEVCRNVTQFWCLMNMIESIVL